MRRWLIALLLCLQPLAAQAEVAVPPLAARVTDLTGTLTAEQRASLEERLRAFEKQKGSQVAVLLVPTTQPETIEQYSIRVVEQWKLGRKKVDDGVLLLVAKDDHKLRIEVGYGLEGTLPDAIAKRIVSDDIAPHFKQGDFYGGIVAGVTRIMAVIEGEPLPAPDQTQESPAQDNAAATPLEDYFLYLLGGALIVSLVLQLTLGTLRGALASGGLTGGAVFLLGGGLTAAAVAAFVMFVIGLVGVLNLLSIFLSGGGGGSSGGGFSGGDSFSGGGGSFGGGGASGDW